MAFNQRINFPVLATIGVTGVLLLAVFIIGTQAWFAYEQTNLTDMRIADAGKSDYVNHRDQQLADLQAAPHWAGHSKTKIAIPIAQAMQILIENHGELPSTRPTAKPN